MTRVSFYYDVVCPYSYLETHAVEAAVDHEREVGPERVLGDREMAAAVLESVALAFPTNEHRCHQLANERLDEYQL